MNLRETLNEREDVRVKALASAATPRRSLPNVRPPILRGAVTFLAVLPVGELLTWVGQPLYGAAWYGLAYVVLVNVAVRLRSSVTVDETGAPGRPGLLLTAILAVVVAGRLLVLGMPPFQTQDVDIPVLWSVPLLIGGIMLARSDLLKGAWPPIKRKQQYPMRWRDPWVSPQSVLILVLAALALFASVTVMAIVQQGWRAEVQNPTTVTAVVCAFVIQEWLYRRTVQPMAMRIWRVRAGRVVASGLAGFAWLAGLASIMSIDAVTVIAVAVASAVFGYLAARGKHGLWLALLGCAVVTTALLVHPSPIADIVTPLNLVGSFD